MRIGLFVSTFGDTRKLDDQIDQVTRAEMDGFDSFWLAQVMGVEALTFLALAGQRTQRIELGTAVVPTPTRHPVVMAQQALMAQAATSGRLTLGVGTQHGPVLASTYGLSFDRPALAMKEYLTILRELVDNGTVEFAGEVFNVNTALSIDAPAPLPILLAALGPRMLRLAGAMADGTATWMVGLRTLETHIVPRINAAASAAGRPSPRVCVGIPVAVTDDRVAGRERASKVFQRYSTLPSYRRMLDIEGVDDAADVCIVGDEAAVEAEVRRLASVGASDLLAQVFSVGDDSKASFARTTSLLKSLIGKV